MHGACPDVARAEALSAVRAHEVAVHAAYRSYPGDNGKLSRMSLIEEGEEKKVRASMSILTTMNIRNIR